MRKMKTLVVKMALLLVAGLMLGSCSSDEAFTVEGKGVVKLSLAADVGFGAKTKTTVNEDTYLTNRPTDNYTVKILNSEGSTVSGCEWKYSEVPEGLIELKNGSYKVVAYDGEEFNKTASTREGIYMYGESEFFSVNSDQVAKQTVTCTPACGKLVVKFEKKMAEYFSDYAVHFTTKAVGEGGQIIWVKDYTDPLYVKLDKAGETVTATFNVTTKAGKKVDIQPLTRTMKWGTMWTIHVNSKVESTTGKVGITIEFDDSTTDKPIDIEIPSDWL